MPPGPSSQGPTLGSQGPPGGPSWLLKPICPLSICAWKQEKKINDQNKDCSLGLLPAASGDPWDVDSYPCWGPACSHLLQINELFNINKENGKDERRKNVPLDCIRKFSVQFLVFDECCEICVLNMIF